MRTFAKVVSVLSIGLLGAAAACSGGGDQGDAGSDSGVVKKDAGGQDTAADVPVVCTAADSYTGVSNESATFTPTPTDGGVEAGLDASADAADDGSAEASADADVDATADASADADVDATADASAEASTDAGSTGGAQDYYIYQGDLNADPDTLDIELYTGFGVFKNGIKAGTYTLSGDELNYATCGLCVLIYTDVSGGTPTDTYLATGGTVTISTLQPTLTGTLSNVTFTHVDINSSTFQSMPVGDGCNSSISSLSISAPVTVAP